MAKKKSKSTKAAGKSAKPSKTKKKTKTAVNRVLSPEVIEPEESSRIPVSMDDIDPAEIVDVPEFPSDPGLTISDPLTRYMAEVSKYPLLSREEEHALAVRYFETGDTAAAQQLVTSNLRFVVKVAMEYSKFGAKVIDLIQEGNVGLMQAVKEFNPYKGVRLISYAVWWIRGQIQEHLMRHYSMVRIGTTAKQRKLFYQLQRQRDQLERMGFEAGIAQLSGRLGIPEDEVAEMGQRVLHRDVSLSQPTSTSENVTLMDSQASTESLQADELLELKENLDLLREKISQIEDDLNEREKMILNERLLSDEPITLQEVGNRYGITREAARQIEARLIEKLRKQFF